MIEEIKGAAHNHKDTRGLEQRTISKTASLRKDIGARSSQSIKDITEAKRQKALDLNCELLSKADQVVSIVEEMRSIVRKNQVDEQNNTGYLIGQVEEYVKVFDDQRGLLE